MQPGAESGIRKPIVCQPRSLARAKLGLELGKILQTNGSLVATEKVQAVDRLKAMPVLPALQHLTSLSRPCKPRIELRQT